MYPQIQEVIRAIVAREESKMRLSEVTVVDAKNKVYRRRAWAANQLHSAKVYMNAEGRFVFPDGGGLSQVLANKDDWEEIPTSTTPSVHADEIVTNDIPHMVHVIGGSSPIKVHANFVLAKTEAIRLAKLPGNFGKQIRLLEVVATFMSEVTVKEMA